LENEEKPPVSNGSAPPPPFLGPWVVVVKSLTVLYLEILLFPRIQSVSNYSQKFKNFSKLPRHLQIFLYYLGISGIAQTFP
jgi:hypothetical protein